MTTVHQDVHAWSAEIRNVLAREFPHLVNESFEAEQDYDEWAKPHLRRWARAQGPGAESATELVLRIADERRCARDRDLFDVTCHGMLGVLVDAVEECGGDDPDRDLLDAVTRTFEDMGQTCLQGYTHRVATLVVALRRSLRDVGTAYD